MGRLFMVMTTLGRKSGKPRYTAIEFHEFKGHKYIFSGWGTKTDCSSNSVCCLLDCLSSSPCNPS